MQAFFLAVLAGANMRNTHGGQSPPANENEGGNINCLAAFPTLDHQTLVLNEAMAPTLLMRESVVVKMIDCSQGQKWLRRMLMRLHG